MNYTNHFRKIRFIGFAIPTTPANLVTIGDQNSPSSVAGTYLGNEDVQKDFKHRIEIMKKAVDLAKSKLPPDDGVINVFVAPEFYFHGTLGPYIFKDSNMDPVEQKKGTGTEKARAS